MDPNPTSIDNGFVRLLQEHREGYSLNELSEKLRELTQAVRQVGKSGTLTFKLKLSPASKGAGNLVVVVDAIEINKPELDRESSFFYTDDDNNLLRNNPNQRELALRAVPTPAPAEPQQIPQQANA